MVGRKIGLLLVLLSCFGMISAAEDNIKAYMPWYSAPGNLKEAVFTELEKTINKWFPEKNTEADLIAFFKNGKKLEAWNKIYKYQIYPFVKKQHEKLLPTLEKLNNLIYRSAYMWTIIGDKNKYLPISQDLSGKIFKYYFDMLSKSSMPELFEEINTSGYSRFNTTKRARHIVGKIAQLIEDKILKNLSGSLNDAFVYTGQAGYVSTEAADRLAVALQDVSNQGKNV
jgi:hypothetical protein